MQEPPATGGGLYGKGLDLKGRSFYSTIKGFCNHLPHFAFAIPAIGGGHGVHSTSGGNLHQSIVKGLSNAPFPVIYYNQKSQKASFFYAREKITD